MRKVILILITSIYCCGVATVFADNNSSIEFLNSNKKFPFSEAVRVGNVLYLSGQLGIVPGSSKLAAGGIEGETRQTMQNIKVTLEKYGYSMSDLVKCTAMLADIKEWGAFNKVYKSFFSERYPARSALGVNGLALNARIEIECIAAVDK